MNASQPPDWFGHPRGLTILFLTETWEKFSYYGMRAILVYYLTKQLMIAQADASLVYGLYTGFAALTPLFGGPLSDRWLGRRRAVVIGGSIMAVGHFLMAFEPLVYVALGTIALGNGLYLPNLPAQIQSLYAPDDPRSKGAINVYYVGINLGAFAAPLTIGTVGEIWGWHYGFALAGIGMVAGLAIYLFGQKYLPDNVRAVNRPAPAKTSAAAGGSRLGLMVSVVLAVVLLRLGYEQNGNTIALWADTGIDRSLSGWTIPMTWFVSLNPLIVFILTPLIVAHWTRRAAAGHETPTGRKMAFGAAIVAVSFLGAALAAWTAGDSRASFLWLAAFFVILTVGELYVLPVGLGLFVRLASPGREATAVAIWFGSLFFGSIGAGLVGRLWIPLGPAAFFLVIASICAVAALGLLLLSPRIASAEALPKRLDKDG